MRCDFLRFISESHFLICDQEAFEFLLQISTARKLHTSCTCLNAMLHVSVCLPVCQNSLGVKQDWKRCMYSPRNPDVPYSRCRCCSVVCILLCSLTSIYYTKSGLRSLQFMSTCSQLNWDSSVGIVTRIRLE
jgi:hypothetical protein